MSKVEDFLTVEEEKEIVNAIKIAEKNTSGEIRVHIEGSSNGDVFARAQEIFNELKMHQTQLRNGVLIYIAVNDKSFVICGDEGIDKLTPSDFWETTKNVMTSFFKKNEFKNGIIEGILKAGKELKKHFPWQKDDIDELPNEISKG